MGPATLIIFGATGDLAHKKLVPALYGLEKDGKLDPKTRIVCIGRRDWNDATLVKEYRREVGRVSSKVWSALAKKFRYHRLEFHDPAGYDSLKNVLAGLPQDRLFYLATPQDAFPLIVEHLARTGIASRRPENGWHRVVFEKPFGSDLKSARELNSTLTRLFDEHQIYRIDHYVGKLFVQEIMVLRFANPVFERIWNRDHIESVRVVVSERSGVGTRGGYYDKSGALRDMVQNHLLQMLALCAMEPPKDLSPESIREAKTRLLKDVKLTNDIVCGQYIAGGGIPSYSAEAGVEKGSKTETLAALKLRVANRRWRGVPFALFTGKALDERYAEVVIRFKPDGKLFADQQGLPLHNELRIRIQPEEGVRFTFNLADQDAHGKAVPVMMDYCKPCEEGRNTPESYELLLKEVLRGDQTLFTRWDFVEEAWKITDRLREKCGEPILYEAGGKGPLEALRLLQ